MNKKVFVTGLIVMLAALPQFISTQPACASVWKIENLQQEIDARGHKWKAGKTSISDLSSEESASLLTYRLPEEGHMMDRNVSLLASFAAPAALDWRNYNGGNWISPIQNQRRCGSCYSFATSGTFETLIKLSQNNPRSAGAA